MSKEYYYSTSSNVSQKKIFLGRYKKISCYFSKGESIVKIPYSKIGIENGNRNIFLLSSIESGDGNRLPDCIQAYVGYSDENLNNIIVKAYLIGNDGVSSPFIVRQNLVVSILLFY